MPKPYENTDPRENRMKFDKSLVCWLSVYSKNQNCITLSPPVILLVNPSFSVLLVKCIAYQIVFQKIFWKV